MTSKKKSTSKKSTTRKRKNEEDAEVVQRIRSSNSKMKSMLLEFSREKKARKELKLERASLGELKLPVGVKYSHDASSIKVPLVDDKNKDQLKKSKTTYKDVKKEKKDKKGEKGKKDKKDKKDKKEKKEKKRRRRMIKNLEL